MAVRPVRSLPNRLRAWGLRHPFSVSLAVFVVILLLVVGRVEQNRRHDDASTSRTRLANCQDSNARSAGFRGKLQIQNDVFADLGIDPVAIARLSVVVGTPDNEDIDCNANGQVDLGDYPVGRSPAEILSALRTAAGLIVTSQPDAPVVIESTPVPSTSTTTGSLPRRRTTTTTRPTTTTSPPLPARPATPTTSTTNPCVLLGVLVPLCPIPGL